MKNFRFWIFLLIASLFLILSTAALCQENPAETQSFTEEPVSAPELYPPVEVKALDAPNDKGGTIEITWKAPSRGEKPEYYIIERAKADSGFTAVGKTVRTAYDDQATVDNVNYRYRVGSFLKAQTAFSETTGEVYSHDTWFRSDYRAIMAGFLIFTLIVVVFIELARKGTKLFVRKIPGLVAVEEAIGRATEMGRPVLFVPGISDIDVVGTIAALNILGEVTKRIVQYDVTLICPNIYPVTYTVAREIVKEAYNAGGRPDAFNPNSVFFITQDQFAYAAAVDGIMMREKPATNFFMGTFRAESLILAETGAMTGAIQIAGTDAVTQLPFFIVACDYTLIGEELYAASSLLSGEPLLLGTLKAQDYGKLIIILLFVLLSLITLIFKWDFQMLFR